MECTNTFYFNPDRSIAFVEFRWHVISYSGDIRENADSGCGGGGGGTDPIYMNSYDPYAPEQAEDTASVQDCGGSGGGGGGGELECWWEWMEIEISYDGGVTWQPFWSGLGQVCQQSTT